MKRLSDQEHTHRLRAALWRAVAYTLAGNLKLFPDNRRIIEVAEDVDHLLSNRQELLKLLSALEQNQ